MVRRIPSWLSKFAKLYIQYFCASLASIPAGLLAFALIRSGLSEFISLSVAIILGIVLAAIIWQSFDRESPAAWPAPIQTKTAAMNFNWQIQNAGGGIGLAGTLVILTTVVSPMPTTEYKSLNTGCSAGTAIRMQALSNKE